MQGCRSSYNLWRYQCCTIDSIEKPTTGQLHFATDAAGNPRFLGELRKNQFAWCHFVEPRTNGRPNKRSWESPARTSSEKSKCKTRKRWVASSYKLSNGTWNWSNIESVSGALTQRYSILPLETRKIFFESEGIEPSCLRECERL